MTETQTELIKTRRPRRDKGVRRGPRKSPEPPETEEMAPVHVRVTMKSGAVLDFEAREHSVEGAFHVFVYPSARNKYYDTRREIAVSEIVDIEITEMRQRKVYDFTRPSVLPIDPPRILPAQPEIHAARGDGRPVIHSAKDDIMRRLKEQADSEGPARIDQIPEINRVKVSLGGSDG